MGSAFVIAGVVLVLAQPLLNNRLGNLLGNSQMHHLVLLDDSFSMSDRRADADAFEEAKEVVRRIGAEAGRQVQPRTFTLLRFSQAGGVSSGTQPDMLEEAVDSEFAGRLQVVALRQEAGDLQRIGSLAEAVVGGVERAVIRAGQRRLVVEADVPRDRRHRRHGRFVQRHVVDPDLSGRGAV